MKVQAFDSFVEAQKSFHTDKRARVQNSSILITLSIIVEAIHNIFKGRGTHVLTVQSHVKFVRASDLENPADSYVYIFHRLP